MHLNSNKRPTGEADGKNDAVQTFWAARTDLERQRVIRCAKPAIWTTKYNNTPKGKEKVSGCGSRWHCRSTSGNPRHNETHDEYRTDQRNQQKPFVQKMKTQATGKEGGPIRFLHERASIELNHTSNSSAVP